MKHIDFIEMWNVILLNKVCLIIQFYIGGLDG